MFTGQWACPVGLFTGLRPYLHTILILSFEEHLQRILAARALRALILFPGCQD